MSRAFGIGDEELERAGQPMTREEVRAVILHKLRLEVDSVVADIGAGTGSLSIEAALLAKEGRVYAVEKEARAIEAVEANLARFSLRNVEIIHGEAPQALNGLPELDRAVVGGSSGRLAGILSGLRGKLKANARVVVSIVTLENLSTALSFFRGEHCEVVEITTARVEGLGRYSALKGRNPIFIFTAEL